jgi:REP-associated tyrosine transposase
LGQTYFRIWLHLVWTTKDRFLFLTSDLRKKLFAHIKRNTTEKDYKVDSINGTDDHMHLLLSLNPKLSISNIVNEIKGESSHWIIHFTSFQGMKNA